RPPQSCDLLARRDVGDGAAGGPAGLQRDLGEQPGLGGGDDTVRHADAHHEVAGRGLAGEGTHPLQALLVVGGDRLPALAREAHEVHVEPVLLGLERLDAVHFGRGTLAGSSSTPFGRGTLAGSPSTPPVRRRNRTAHALSSGWRESGSRVLSVRLLALL